MNIKFVNECGFERLYNGLMNLKQMQFGEGLDVILSHLAMSFFIRDINSFELLMLKKFCADVSVINKSVSTTNDSYPNNVKNEIESLRILSRQIESDCDISENSCPLNILPLASVKYDVVATFRGMNITSITGLMFKSIFKDDSPNASTPYFSEYPKNKMSDILCKLFISSFYKFIAAQIDTVDIASQFQLQVNFFNNIKDSNKNIAISHINTIGGSINFVNSADNFNDELNAVKLTKAKYPKLNLVDSAEYFFTVKSSIDTYVIMKCILDCVVSEESILPLKMIEDINVEDDIQKKYSNRINESLNKVIDYRNSLEDNNPHKYALLISGQNIMYNIKFSSKFNKNEIIDKLSIVSIYSELSDIIENIDYIISNFNQSF